MWEYTLSHILPRHGHHGWQSDTPIEDVKLHYDCSNDTQEEDYHDEGSDD